VAAHATYGLGMTDGTTHYAIYAGAEDNISTATTSRSRGSIENDECLVICDVDGDMVSEASFSSFDSDGMTINWGTNDGSAYKFWVLYLRTKYEKRKRPGVSYVD